MEKNLKFSYPNGLKSFRNIGLRADNCCGYKREGFSISDILKRKVFDFSQKTRSSFIAELLYK